MAIMSLGQIKPTIGRIVWYWPQPNFQGWMDHSQPLAAIIAYVHSDVLINIGFYDQNGKAEFATSVKLWQGDGDRPDSFFAEWMPYQKGQAAKYEALEKTLGAK